MTAQLLRPFQDLSQPLLLLPRVPKATADMLAVRLLQSGVVSAEDMVGALAQHAACKGKLTDILLSRGAVSEAALYAALADHWKLRLVDPTRTLPDPRLIDRYSAQSCMAQGLLPFAHTGASIVILASDPDDFARHRIALIATFGPVSMALAAPSQIEVPCMACAATSLPRALKTGCRTSKAAVTGGLAI